MKFPSSCVLIVPLIAALALASCDDKGSAGAGAKPPKGDGKTAQVDPKGAKAGEKAEEADWCAEHGVPESVCTRCNPKLIAEFKQKGDWCKEHSVPESQCIKCDPSLKEKLEAMKPKGN